MPLLLDTPASWAATPLLGRASWAEIEAAGRQVWDYFTRPGVLRTQVAIPDVLWAQRVIDALLPQAEFEKILHQEMSFAHLNATFKHFPE